MQSSSELQAQDYTSDYYNNYYNQQRRRKVTKPKVYFDFHKTKMCPYLESDVCPNGSQCTFAHSASELREMPKLEKTKMCEGYLQGSCLDAANCKYAHGESELKSTQDLYKTSMCFAFLQGNCNSGEHCRYAHGEEELRMPPPERVRYQPATQRNKYYSQQQFDQGYGDKRYPSALTKSTTHNLPCSIHQTQSIHTSQMQNNNMQLRLTNLMKAKRTWS